MDYKLIRHTHKNIVFIIFYSLSLGLQALPSLGATYSNSNNLGNNNTSINQLNKKKLQNKNSDYLSSLSKYFIFSKNIIKEKITKENDLRISLNNKDLEVNKKKNAREILKTQKTLFIKRKGYLKLNGPALTLSFKDVPAKDALQVVLKMGGYGYVYVPKEQTDEKKELDTQKSRLITLSFEKEEYEIIINSILIASGLQGKKEGDLIFVGEDVLNIGFNPESSRVYKMKNTSASSGADYLASLGAVINKVYLTNIGGPKNDSLEKNSEQNYSVKSFGANQGPLRGLTGTTDTRLETITLVGDLELISLAEDYLTEIDQSLNQVAMSVKILDVNLSNGNESYNSLKLKTKNPPMIIDNNSLGFSLDIGNLSQSSMSFNPDFNGTTDFINSLFYKISSNDTKVLASPTLILSESKDDLSSGAEVAGDLELSTSSIGRPRGNESFVTVGTKVITNYNLVQQENSLPVCEAEFGTAGLTFGARIHKVSSNGYVSFSLSPELSSITSSLNSGTCGLVNVLSIRRLDTGIIRVKDGETFALTGVISDNETEIETKLPIIGDIPLIGIPFRNRSKNVTKNELIILVTPKIIDQKYSIKLDEKSKKFLTK